jgi:hypothetical protein
MGQQGVYTYEADMNDAGDLKWNALAKADRAMEWMRRLAEKQVMEVSELRLGTAGDLNSTARLMMGY